MRWSSVASRPSTTWTAAFRRGCGRSFPPSRTRLDTPSAHTNKNRRLIPSRLFVFGERAASQFKQPADLWPVEAPHTPPADVQHRDALLPAAPHHIARRHRVAADVHLAEADPAFAHVLFGVAAISAGRRGEDN